MGATVPREEKSNALNFINENFGRISERQMAVKIMEKGISGRPRRINDNLYLLQYSCNRGLKLAEWIYRDNGLCLQRKFQQYKNALVAGGGGLL